LPENHTLHSGTYPYSLYMGVPPPPGMGISIFRCGGPPPVNRELKQTTTTTATRKSQNKRLMSKRITVHVRYRFLNISLPSAAKQQREMTKFCVVYGTWTTTANFSYFHLEIECCHCIFSLRTFLEPLAYRTVLENREFRG